MVYGVESTACLPCVPITVYIIHIVDIVYFLPRLHNHVYIVHIVDIVYFLPRLHNHVYIIHIVDIEILYNTNSNMGTWRSIAMSTMSAILIYEKWYHWKWFFFQYHIFVNIKMSTTEDAFHDRSYQTSSTLRCLYCRWSWHRTIMMNTMWTKYCVNIVILMIWIKSISLKLQCVHNWIWFSKGNWT